MTTRARASHVDDLPLPVVKAAERAGIILEQIVVSTAEMIALARSAVAGVPNQSAIGAGPSKPSEPDTRVRVWATNAQAERILEIAREINGQTDV